jgi:hypothetical protein
MFVPGNCRSVAKQLLRVVIHQLANSGICLRLFQTKIENANIFWSTIACALVDFTEFNSIMVIQTLFEVCFLLLIL